MLIPTTFVFLIFGLIESGNALQCIDCIYVDSSNQGAVNNLQTMFGDKFDLACRDNPTAVTKTASCDGSCAYVDIRSSVTFQGTSTSINMIQRVCYPSKSQKEGCKTLNANNLRSLNLIGAGFDLDQQVSGQICFCNGDNCTRDISSLPNLPKAPSTQCHTCSYMKYQTDDPDSQKYFDKITQSVPQNEPKCKDQGSQTPKMACEGSCMTIGATVKMSVSDKPMTMYMAQRGCVGIETQHSCVKTTDQDPSISQIIPLDSLKQYGIKDFDINMEYCTCNGNECNSDVSSAFNHNGGGVPQISIPILFLSALVLMLFC